jgi:predicted ester cyclase
MYSKPLLIALLAYCSLTSVAQTIKINKKNELKIYEAFNSGDLNQLDKYIAMDAIEHAIPDGKPNGLEGTKAIFKSLKDAFPDGKIKVIEIVAEGDDMLIYSEFTGTNKGAFMGMPATNKMVKFKGMDLVKFNHSGKAIEHWGQDDNVAMLQQLGVIPAAKPIPEIPLKQEAKITMMSTTADQNKMTSQKFFDYFSKADIEGDLTLLAPGFKLWWNSEPVALGAGTYKMLGESYLKAFPNGEWKATLQIAEGNKVASVTSFTGVQTGPLMNFAASGKQVNTKGYIIDHFKNGKITERISLNDDLSLLKQIGAIPNDKK